MECDRKWPFPAAFALGLVAVQTKQLKAQKQGAAAAGSLFAGLPLGHDTRQLLTPLLVSHLQPLRLSASCIHPPAVQSSDSTLRPSPAPQTRRLQMRPRIALSRPSNFATTSSSTPSSTIPLPPGAPAQDGLGDSSQGSRTPTSPALSTASTADDEDDDIGSSPVLPLLPAPKLSERASAILRASAFDLHDFQVDVDSDDDEPDDNLASDDEQFGTASWGSPYLRSDLNLRRQSYASDDESESEGSESFPIHSLDISTPFLRPPPLIVGGRPQTPAQPLLPASAAAAVLVHRARRRNRRLTEGWIRTHTAGDQSTEARLWFSDGDSSEHSSLSGSESDWYRRRDPRTPTPSGRYRAESRSTSRHPRTISSVETLKAGDRTQADLDDEMESPVATETGSVVGLPVAEHHNDMANAEAPQLTAENTNIPAIDLADKPLPREPAATPRIKKKVPWKGKNIMILIPRDDERGRPGQPPLPLRQDEIQRMFDSWTELGYNVDGFDLPAEDNVVDESQSRELWPSLEDLAQERHERDFTVVLPDLNAWKNYVNELQEAKLRALGVSFGGGEPEAAPSISSQPSRMPSAQYPPLPFSPPIPTSSASSSHAIPGFPFPAPFIPGAASTQSPGLPAGASPVHFGVHGKFSTRQSISFPATSSPFQQPPQGWQNQAGALHGLSPLDSPSAMNFNGIMSPQSPYGIEGFNQAGSPAFNLHQRHQSLQYLPQQYARASPRLQDVREDEEEEEQVGKSPSKTPESTQRNADQLQAEIDDAEYHLEEQLRNELEHEDYNPQTRAESINHQPFASAHGHQPSAGGFATVEHFANEPSKPLVLHHPRPHSRGHSLTQNFYRDSEPSEGANQGGLPQFAPLNDIPEAQRVDEAYDEIQTNPSNLGTPIQDIDFAAAFSQHQKNMSASSNPWQDAVSLANGGGQHSTQDSKSSLSKFNVEAPEFKFNPTSTFTPGAFNFSASSFQPAVLHAAPPEATDQTPFGVPPQQPPAAAKINVNAPTFAPGQSEFSFSSSGPKFRPDAPAFTPFQSQANSAPSAAESSDKGVPKRSDSIFGDINVEPEQLVDSEKSKAIPTRRPSSTVSADTPAAYEGDVRDPDGRVGDISRVKRAKSANLSDTDDVPLFADQPADDSVEDLAEEEETAMVESSVKEARSVAEEGSVDGEAVLRADTSMSSVDQIDTQVTTAAPSEISPAEAFAKWKSSFHQTPRQLSVATPVSLPEDTEPRSDRDDLSESTQPQVLSAPEDPQVLAARRKLTPKGLAGSRFALPQPKPSGLAASRYAGPTPAAAAEQDDGVVEQVQEEASTFNPTPTTAAGEKRSPTFEEIDAVMQRMERDHSQGVNKSVETFKWPRPSVEVPASSDELHIPSDHAREEMSIVPRQYSDVPDNASLPLISTELEDPFVDPPVSAQAPRRGNAFAEEELESEPLSDWEGAFSEDEHSKLQNRAQFFDGRVNDVVGNLLASRLEPLEKALLSLHQSMTSRGQRAPSSRRDARGGSTEYQESDADDEDDEPLPRRSTSPKRDRRLDQIRSIVVEALASQQRSRPAPTTEANDDTTLLKSLDEIRGLLVSSARPTPRGDESAPFENTLQVKPDEELLAKIRDLETKNADLESRRRLDQENLEREICERRAAEDAAAELDRKLQTAETRVEIEIINRSVFDQRVADLEQRLRTQEDLTEQEVKTRRTAEDNLSEVQRLFRNASEEEARLRGMVEERDRVIKTLEHSASKTTMQLTTLEAARDNWTHQQAEMVTRINVLEADLRNVRQDNSTWRAEAERADEAARRSNGELGHALDENKRLHRALTSVVAQLEENERLRESWRAKFISLQEDMGQAAREVAEDNARRIKRDQAMLARQEVLEARLQAESKTRERLEVEMERLQDNERAGMRAVNECNRMEEMLSELRTENFKLQQSSARYQREFEEARESGASEVKRTRMSLQTELDAANNQVNVVREEYEEQNAKLRAELDHLKLAIDTAKVQNEMLLEAAQSSSAAELEELKRKHENELEDIQTRWERQVHNAIEDGQRTEQHLLERLSLSTSKTEHLQDRILHLEEKLEVTKQAAAAAAQAAKSAGVDSSVLSSTMAKPAERVEMPERISPQALRESIMVLQEQLQAREQHIEELEQTVAELDPDAATKISKRDDEISWLRELLAVRQGDLQDIISALSGDRFDRAAVRDAAIRLKANLQMEEQERERAMNGGSAITLPNIAQTIQAATPRVAQTIAPLAAAWGNWRKSGQSSFRNISGVLSSPAVTANSTPSKSRNDPMLTGGALSGLLTPPATALRQSPTPDNQPQPTAFSSTGRRFTGQSISQERTRRESNISHRSDKSSFHILPHRRQELAAEPVTPPSMMHQTVYDEDAQPGDFDDHDFFEED
ncbi:hypothetical protein J3F83DRAFT_719009 [Trichoderma novae-zelandiae]